MKAFIFVLVFLCTQNIFAESIAPGDRDFILVGHSKWTYESSDNDNESPQKFIEESQKFLEEYKKGNMSFKDYAHTEKGLESLFFLLEKNFPMYEAALSKAKDYDDFWEIVEGSWINFRTAVVSAKTYEALKQNISEASKESVNKILKGGPSEGTASELQFVFAFVFRWDENLTIQENENLSKTGVELIEKAKGVFKTMKDLNEAPSDRSEATAINVVSQMIKTLEAANKCAKNIDELQSLANPHLESIFKAMEEGLTSDKSLKQIDKKVNDSSKKALKTIGKCKS